ncbi:MAG: hypothetical protein HUJ60_05565 [Bacilli bacterium]|nr:hypothetical protein [Bacilli bacterium]
MKTFLRTMRYEARKLFHDRGRLFFFLLCLAILVAIAFFLPLIRMGYSSKPYEPNIPVWSEELAATYRSQMEARLSEYNALMAKGTPASIKDAEEALRQYKRLSFLLDNRIAFYYEGYGANQYVFRHFHNLHYQNFEHLAAVRLFYYQDLIFLFVPLLLVPFVFSVFAHERTTGFDKNVMLLGVNPRPFLLGKAVFSLLFLAAFSLLTFFAGFAFFSTDVIVTWNGSAWYALPAMQAYFERFIEHFLVWLAFLSLDVFLSAICPSVIYWILALPVSLSLLPCLIPINENFGNPAASPTIGRIPFLSAVVSDGFADGRFLSDNLFVIILIVVFALAAGFVFLSKKSLRHKEEASI